MQYISFRSAAVARSCWKKFDFDINQKLSPAKHSTGLITGKIIHKAFEKHYLGEQHKAVLDYIRDAYAEEISKVELIDQENLTVARYTALGMFGNYPFNVYDAEIDKIIPELEFEVTLGDLRGVRFIGRIDGLIEHKGKWWVREFKTTGLSLRQFEGRAQNSAQATGYVYASGKKQRVDIAGVMFDIIKRPMLRKRVTEDADQFGMRILKDYHDRPEHYYHRYYTYRTPQDIDIWVRDMCSLQRDIRAHERTGKYYRNPEACWQFNSECPYSKICWTDVPDQLTKELCFTRRLDYAERKQAEDNSPEQEEIADTK